ncbi:unnamed protein product [Ilex paraguariensis]|uniref:Uncharacterized protein n=1 Tax=Ilex paraguariensis TaxID=185542 RepID=A0ABC8TL98_9AQUA
MNILPPHAVFTGLIQGWGWGFDVVRTLLPSVIPPSYRGATIRYLYYVRSTLSGQYLMLENGHFPGESIRDLAELHFGGGTVTITSESCISVTKITFSNDFYAHFLLAISFLNYCMTNGMEQEARIPLQIWVTQKTNGLLIEGGQTDGIVPAITIILDVYWREMDRDSDWARANETYDGVEEGYESSRDEISSVSSYNPTKENINKAFGSSLSLQSSVARSSNRDSPYIEERTSISSHLVLPRLSVAEILYDSSGDVLSPQKASAMVSPSQQIKHVKSLATDDESRGPSVPGTVEPIASEGFIRGRSYNIRLDDQVLLRFSPKNSDATYYFSDMIGGTLTFFHEERARRCLELLITLELSETISRRSVHPSRRHSPTVTKVFSDYHEVVADLVQTSFLFSIPMDGPMSFSTRHVSVQWALRFEFFTTPKNVDWTRFVGDGEVSTSSLFSLVQLMTF